MKTMKFKPSEIGPIPEEWEVKRLGDIADIQLGKMVDEEKNVGTLKYYLSNRDVHWGHIDVSDLHQVRMSDDDLHKYDLRDGDLLVCEGGEVGRAAIWHAPKTDCYFQKTLHRVRVKAHLPLCISYLQGLLRRYADIGFFDAYVAKTSIAHLPKDKFEILPILLPTRAEQEKIAAALSDVDELLVAMTTLIEKKRAIKQGAMQELLEVRPTALTQRTQSAQRGAKTLRTLANSAFFASAPAGENPVNLVNSDEKTYAPRRRLAGFTGAWVEKRFDDCFDIISNNTYAREFMCSDESGVANIHYGDVLIKYGSVLDFAASHVDSLRLSVLIKSENLKDGDLIIADTAEDETAGKAVEIQNLGARRAVAGLHTVACRPKMRFAPGWLGYYINSHDYHDQLLPLITGIKVASISKAGFRQTILHIPTLAEQKAIAGVLADMDAEIAALEAKRAKYEQIKQGMMQELLTGRVRLVG